MQFLSLSLIIWLIRLLSSIKPGLVKKINRLPTPIAGLVSVVSVCLFVRLLCLCCSVPVCVRPVSALLSQNKSSTVPVCASICLGGSYFIFMPSKYQISTALNERIKWSLSVVYSYSSKAVFIISVMAFYFVPLAKVEENCLKHILHSFIWLFFK